MGGRLTAWAIDLDGVVWRGPATVPGAPEAVATLRDRGRAIAFVTNSSARTPAQVAAKLAGHGIPDAEDLVITSAMAAAEMIPAGSRALVIGADGLRAALAAREIEEVTGDARADAVVVGITAEFDYRSLTDAMRAVRAGARFIATNDDATFPDDGGLLPGNGALVAAVATAAGRAPEVAGKPHEPIAAFVRARLGTDGIVAGDRPETDGEFALSLGYRFGLVFTGVTAPGDLPTSPPADVAAEDLGALVDAVEG